MMHSLKADNGPTEIVNTLQSTCFIGKYMLLFLWTFDSAIHPSVLTSPFFRYITTLEMSFLYPNFVETRENCSYALTNLPFIVTPEGSVLVCMGTSLCM